MDEKDKVYITDFLSDEEILEAVSEGMGYDSPDDLRIEVDYHLSQETIENQAQSTDQLNLRIMIGVHRFFDGLTKYH